MIVLHDYKNLLNFFEDWFLFSLTMVIFPNFDWKASAQL